MTKTKGLLIYCSIILSSLFITEVSSAVACRYSAIGNNDQGTRLYNKERHGFSSFLVNVSATGVDIDECVQNLNLNTYQVALSLCSKRFYIKPKSNARRDFVSHGTISVYKLVPTNGGNRYEYLSNTPFDCAN